MSTHDSTSVPSSSPGAKPAHDVPQPGSSYRRSLILLGVLALLLIALWYDYKVARPNVETAYETIEKINNEYNALPGKKYVTEKEVQLTLNRKPARIISEGPYHVEVYSWRAGLPIRSHNYYAVYSAGTPLIFLKHYKFELPMDELQLVREGAVGGEGGATADQPNMSEEMQETYRKRRPDADRSDGTRPPGEQPGGDASSQKPEPATLTEAPKEEAAKSEAPKEDSVKEAPKEEPAKSEAPKEEPAKTP